MNKERVQLLIDALKSGEYKQGTGCLKKGDRFCCLGVACDLYAKENGLAWHVDPKQPSDSILDERRRLPDKVKEWFGFPCFGGIHHEDFGLPTWNDDGTPFETIAGFLEQALNEK